MIMQPSPLAVAAWAAAAATISWVIFVRSRAGITRLVDEEVQEVEEDAEERLQEEQADGADGSRTRGRRRMRNMSTIAIAGDVETLRTQRKGSGKPSPKPQSPAAGAADAENDDEDEDAEAVADVAAGALPAGRKGTGLLFITGVHPLWDARFVKRRIQQELQRFHLEHVVIPKNSSRNCRGYAYARLRTPADASAAVNAFATSGLIIPQRDGTPVPLTVAVALDKRDSLFPFLTAQQRSQLQLDAVAHFSVMDQLAATRLGTLLQRIAAIGRVDASVSDLRITDATACVGGSALAFAGPFAHVTAVELDARRAAMLKHNATVFGAGASAFTAICGDYCAMCTDLVQDVVFVDPPWGGTAYSSAAAITELPLGSESMMSLSHRLKASCGVLAIRLPANYVLGPLVQSLVAPDMAAPGRPLVRPAPFFLEFGAARVLLVCFPSYGAPGQTRLSFDNDNLDAVIKAIHSWNQECFSEHRPRFFDWEKQRWIQLKYWKGCKLADGNKPTEQQ